MAIEHSMDRAFGRQWDVGEAAQQPLADFASTPAGMFVLHIQNVILHLKGKLVSVAIGTPASVGQPLHPAFLITIEDLVAGLARNAELPAQIRHRLPSQSPSHELNSFIHDRTLLPRHPLSSQQKGESVTYVSGTICYLCVGSFICLAAKLLDGHGHMFFLIYALEGFDVFGTRIDHDQLNVTHVPLLEVKCLYPQKCNSLEDC